MSELLWKRARTLAEWVLTSILDAIALAVWVLIQWAFKEFGEAFAISLVDAYVVQIFQVILALGTLTVPVVFIYEDIYRMWYQARANVRKIAEEAGA